MYTGKEVWKYDWNLKKMTISLFQGNDLSFKLDNFSVGEGKTVFILSSYTSKTDKEVILTAIDLQTGKLILEKSLWKEKIIKSERHTVSLLPYPENLLLFENKEDRWDNQIKKYTWLDIDTGKEKNIKIIVEEKELELNPGFTNGNLLISSYPNTTNQFSFQAWNLDTLSKIWTSKEFSLAHSGLEDYLVFQNDLYFITQEKPNENKLTCIDLSNGKLLWQKPIQTHYGEIDKIFRLLQTNDSIVCFEFDTSSSSHKDDVNKPFYIQTFKRNGEKFWESSNAGMSFIDSILLYKETFACEMKDPISKKTVLNFFDINTGKKTNSIELEKNKNEETWYDFTYLVNDNLIVFKSFPLGYELVCTGLK